MSIRYHARIAVALLAAYGVALQGILLLAAGPVGAASEFSGEFAGLPLCAAAAGSGHSVPADHDHDCLGACLAGCCGGAPALARSAFAVPSPLSMRQSVPRVFAAAPVSRIGALGAHRSRAPPLA